ncbi:site-specific integrase [Rhodobacteraceae bacterium R_SAG8]|nr:site-specific integrase [Rhodobacteraceae bacterium R_SAG8]
MSVQAELRSYLNTSGESMRALSQRAGLNPKAVSDILNISGIQPHRQTIDRLSSAIGYKLPIAPIRTQPTYADLISVLETMVFAEGSTAEKQRLARLVRRVRWLLRKTNWVAQTKIVDRANIIQFFRASRPATFDLSPGSFANYKSDLLRALDITQVRARKRGVSDISGPHAEIHRMIREAEDLPLDLKNIAGSFLVFLHDNEIAFGAVTTQVLQAYYEHRLAIGGKAEGVCIKHVKRITTLLAKLSVHSDFVTFGFSAPAHPFSDRRNKYGVSVSDIAAVLNDFDLHIAPWARGEVSRDGQSRDAYIAMLDEKGPIPTKKKSKLKGNKPKAVGKKRKKKLRKRGFLVADETWSENTIAVRRGYVAAAAKALYSADGFLIETVEELTDPQVVDSLAEALSSANQGEYSSGYLENILKMILKIARSFVRRKGKDLKEIRATKDFYAHTGKGIAPRNKAKLQEFTDQRIQSFIDLGDTIIRQTNARVKARRKAYREANGKLPPVAEVYTSELARDVMAALAHEIMLLRAPRSANFTNIQLKWIGWQGDEATITVPAVEVKMRSAKDTGLTIPLNEITSQLLRSYVDKIRPMTLQENDKSNPFLFPCQGLRGFKPNRPYKSILKRLCRDVHTTVGVKINPHLYRHLIGWVWLREDPDRLPDVQKLLGHKSLKTTLDYYAEIDENLALDRWQKFINKKKGKRK